MGAIHKWVWGGLVGVMGCKLDFHVIGENSDFHFWGASISCLEVRAIHKIHGVHSKMGLGWVHWGSGGVKVNFSSGPSINFWGSGGIHKVHGGHPQVDGLGSRFGLGGLWGVHGGSGVAPK